MPRYFIQFPNSNDRAEARRMLDVNVENYQPFYPMHNESAQKLLIAELSDEERATAERNGCQVFEDFKFEPVDNKIQPRALNPYKDAAGTNFTPLVSAPWQTKSVVDVMDHIDAPKAWKKARGKNVTIGIVDSGISSVMPEFPASKLSQHSKSYVYSSPWNDSIGHGSMCACAAGATSSSGGKFDGVAPDSMLMSLRTSLYATDIYKLYEWVIMTKKADKFPGPVVLSNSYGSYVCSPPNSFPNTHPYYQIVKEAVRENIPVIFAAGNNHFDELCNHDPTQCSPNSIWLVNSADEVMSVGTVNWNNKMDTGKHANSSRGPGQWASAGSSKPDCVAPTYGEIVWGSSYTTMEWWGTSGACPQVAGLAALILSIDPSLTPSQVYDIIRKSCDSIGLPKNCAGSGIINCLSAVNAV